MRGRILVADDEKERGRSLADDLEQLGFEVSRATTRDEALARLEREEHDVVVAALALVETDSFELCEDIAVAHPTIPVVIAAAATIDKALAAIRSGAYDFLPSPSTGDAASVVLTRAIQHHELVKELRRLRREARRDLRYEGLYGQSEPMAELFRLIERTAVTDASILIVGETGTGKELVAQALHKASRRAGGPFVPVNCAAVQDTLLESELFGHEKGAFTDARTARVGMFVQAHGGTLFLDEIGEMSPSLQPKLLRALQERRVRPVGANTEVEVDVRIIAATNRDLEAEAESGLFRRDLYYRLNVITINVPPLRVRGNDILSLAQRFIEGASERSGAGVSGVSRGAAERLLAYTWPGNVRELQNAMERAVALAEHDEIQVQDLPERIQNAKRRARPLLQSDETGELITLEELEERYIRRVLELMGGNRSMAARTLGLDRTTLYRKLKRFGLSEAPAGD